MLLADLEAASAILFNILAATAAVAAAIRYFALTKATTAHTLLGISWSPVLTGDNARLIELAFDVQTRASRLSGSTTCSSVSRRSGWPTATPPVPRLRKASCSTGAT